MRIPAKALTAALGIAGAMGLTAGMAAPNWSGVPAKERFQIVDGSQGAQVVIGDLDADHILEKKVHFHYG